MHTKPGTKWEAIPTELDELWCPLMEFAAGCAESDVFLIVEGAPKGSDDARFYLLQFSRFAMITGYRESIYCTFSEDQAPGQAKISAVIDSELVAQFNGFGGGPLRQFMVGSGGMHCEVIASPDFRIERFQTRESALRSAQEEFENKTINLDAASPEATAVLRSMGRQS